MTDQFKLFVCNIGKTMTNEDLKTCFAPFGNVIDVNVVGDKTTGLGKGFGFVTFQFYEEATAAIQALNDKHTFPGNDKRCIVRFKDEKFNFTPVTSTNQAYGYPSVPSSAEPFKLFICNIGKTMTPEELQSIFQPFGEITDLSIVKDRATGEPKGFAFVSYSSQASAQAAIAALHGKRTFPGNEKAVIVRFKDDNLNRTPLPPAAPMYYPMMPTMMPPQSNLPFMPPMGMEAYPGYPPQMYMPPQMMMPFMPSMPVVKQPIVDGPPGSNLFVCYLPPELMDEQLRALFAQFGNLVCCQIHRDAQGFSKAYGWVNYDNPTSAMAAMQNLNGMAIGSKRIKVQLNNKESKNSLAIKPY